MRYLLPILMLLSGFLVGLYYSDYGLVTGSIVFTNFKSKDKDGDVTFSDVLLIGERKFLRRETEIIYKDFPLYGQRGNRLLRIIEEDIKRD